jgi:hypothetical protein
MHSLVQTHRCAVSDLPDHLQRNMQTWHQDGLRYVYFDNDAARRFIATSYSAAHAEVFDRIDIGAFKADFFRYCYLYVHGGFYADTDLQCMLPLVRWGVDFASIDCVLTYDSPQKIPGMYQAFIFVHAGDVLMKRCIEKCVENVDKYMDGATFDPLQFTGPQLVYEALMDLVAHPEQYPPPHQALDASRSPFQTVETFALKQPRPGDGRRVYRMVVLDFTSGDYITLNGRRVLRHKCAECASSATQPDYWGQEISTKQWAVRRPRVSMLALLVVVMAACVLLLFMLGRRDDAK